MANTHLAYPNLAVDRFCGIDLDQDAKSFVQRIERKSNFALRDAPAGPDGFAICFLRKEAHFPLYIQDPQQSVMKIISEKPPLGQPQGNSFQQDFLMDGTNSDTEWERTNTLREATERKSLTFCNP